MPPRLKQFNLLGRGVLGQQPGQIVDLPALGCAPGQQAKALAREARLGDERRDAGQDQNRHQPRTETQQQHREGRQGDGILEDLKGIVDQLHRLVTALAPGVLQFVVVLRVLEKRQVQGQRLADDFTADLVGELELGELLNQPARLDNPSAEQDQYEFNDQIVKYRFRLLMLSAMLDRRHHAVDDQLADPSLRRRQQRAGQREHGQTEDAPMIAAPNKANRLRRVHERKAQFVESLCETFHRVGLGKIECRGGFTNSTIT